MNSFRENYLERVLQKMDELMDSHKKMYDEAEWYDSTFFFEDAEETLGFVFVACQVFILGTIADCADRSEMPIPTKAKEKAMKNAPQFNGARTKIELINSVANYYKHKDEGTPLGETKKILDCYKLLDDEFPISEAFRIITVDEKIDSLAKFLYDWRNHMFNCKIKNGLVV
ncbi:MAG: hypothetical protein EOO45_02840 [Flavobacterium sp.]|nr:MAG: hypothetical protein EOO45_02840 [Flavobacterium sp.]